MPLKIKKAVLPIAGLGTRFLPLSKVFPKELWPLLNRPIIDYIVEETIKAGAEQIIFVNSLEKTAVREYFEPDAGLKNDLKKKGKNSLVLELEKKQKRFQKTSFDFILQKKPLGDGHAILQAKKLVGKEPFMVSFGDDVVIAKTPCLLQLARVFAKYKSPVIAMKKVALAKIGSYGSFKAEKVAPKTYLIKGIVEKPKPGQAPSNLAVVGKYILTPDIFAYLEKAKLFNGEIILANAFEEMIKSGIMVYGYEFEGDWLECGNVQNWAEANWFLAKKQFNL